jgi:transglutaminase-like putative cysteine protease
MTTPKSFCRIRNPRRTISRVARVTCSAALSVTTLGALFVTIFVTMLAHPARQVWADTAPDWLRVAAKETLPEYPKDTVAVTLLDEQQTTVKDNGEIEVRRRFAYKILRPEASKDYDYAGVNFSNDTKISFFKAWTITANGRELELKEKDAIEVGVSADADYSDYKVKVLKFSALEPGNIVGYEYVQKKRPYMFEDDWTFQNELPTRRSRFSLQLPNGWEFTDRWANYPKQEPKNSSGNSYTWEVENIPAIEKEPDMPPFRVLAGRMDIKYFPRDPKLREKSSGSWDDIGLWYGNLTHSSRQDSPELDKKVTELTAGITDPWAKMQALATYVQHSIRYVAIEIGVGGYQPHSATSVFKNQYGDCKDKATLMSAMLKQIGIDSYYVMIHTDRGMINPDFPSLVGNHMILAIKLPDTLPAVPLYGTIDDAKLGKLLVFDPTNSYVPLGTLPNYLQQNYGLLIAPDGGRMILLPLQAASTNRVLRTATFNLSPTGRLDGQVHELRYGGPAVSSREEFLDAKASDRTKSFERMLGAYLNNFTLTGANIGNLELFNETLTLNYNFTENDYAKSAGDLLILRPRVMARRGGVGMFDGKKARKYPIQFDETSLSSDVLDITLPKGYVVDELPPAVDAHCEFASYKSHVEVKDNVMHYVRTYEIKGITVPTDKLPEVRDFFHQVQTAETSSAVLRKQNP